MKRAFEGKRDFLKMVRRYLAGKASPEERAFLNKLYADQDKAPDVLDQYSEAEKEALENEMEQYILSRTNADRRSGYLWKLSWPHFLAAASVALLLLAGLFHMRNAPKPAAPALAVAPKDFSPGKQRAVLTLANGSEVMLDSAQNGQIATQGSTAVTKNENGKLTYHAAAGTGAVVLNTVTTPAGGQYSIVLPDGSQVWLNARSSITFPTAFIQSERRVTIKGECYFEVKKDRSKPFIVDVNGRQEVLVTGTHFNVNAYENESEIRTTLLEGAVQVASAGRATGKNALQLAPGEQSVFNAGGQFDKSNVDVSEVVAWKAGFFQFRETPLKTIMQDLERWYNVEVTYPKGVPQKRFSGKLRRDSNASGILEILRFAGVNFRLEASATPDIQGRIVVLPTEK